MPVSKVVELIVELDVFGAEVVEVGLALVELGDEAGGVGGGSGGGCVVGVKEGEIAFALGELGESVVEFAGCCVEFGLGGRKSGG